MVVRVRPFNDRELDEGAKDVVYMDENKNECTIISDKPRKMASGDATPRQSTTFSFDRCYLADTSTEIIYDEIPYYLVQV